MNKPRPSPSATPVLKKHALLVIDMEMRPADSRSPLQQSTFRDLQALHSLIRAVKELQVPIFFFHYMRDNVIIPSLLQAAEPAGEIIRKYDFDAFACTGLVHKLRASGTTTLIVSGFDAEVCVKYTAQTAKRAGFDLLSARDVLFTPIPETEQHASIRYLYENGIPAPDSGEEYYRAECARFFTMTQELEGELRTRAKRQ